MLNIGDKVPDFKLESDVGGTFSLASFAGGRVVFYFYPKDSTSG